MADKRLRIGNLISPANAPTGPDRDFVLVTSQAQCKLDRIGLRSNWQIRPFDFAQGRLGGVDLPYILEQNLEKVSNLLKVECPTYLTAAPKGLPKNQLPDL
jgi:hypothetical protein